LEVFGVIIEKINGVLWGLPMIVFLFGTHIYMTFKTNFIQKKIFTGIRLSVAKDTDSQGDISQFASLATALASTIGTGNIIGVGTAIALGGPGAVLWCWLTGVFGIATKYAESLIAVKFRVKTESGTMLGGAMYALERGMNQKWLGILFALFASLAAFGIGCGVQANAISGILDSMFGISPKLIGVILSVVTFVVIFGGVKSISKVCEALVPVMSLLYMLGCIVILIYNRAYLLQAFVLIFESAFSPKAAAGGFTGSTIMIAARFGIARGLFSNESGMGSAPIVAAAAKTRNSVRQALVASTGAFWDTVVVCLVTGLVLVSSILSNSSANYIGDDGSRLTADAFTIIPYVGTPILVFGIVSFAYATILGWCYYGERCAEYLFGKKALTPYRFAWLLVLLVSPVINLSLIWNLSDTLNALMAIPNLIAIIGLSDVIQKETNLYINNLDQKDTTEIPVIKPKTRMKGK
jgi:amino acid carrier protein